MMMQRPDTGMPRLCARRAECDGVADVHEKGETNHLNGLEPRGRLKAFGALTFSSREMRNCSWYQSPNSRNCYRVYARRGYRVKLTFPPGRNILEAEIGSRESPIRRRLVAVNFLRLTGISVNPAWYLPPSAARAHSYIVHSVCRWLFLLSSCRAFSFHGNVRLFFFSIFFSGDELQFI